MEQVNNTFWGVVLQSGKQYEQIAEKSFHISMAALDISNAAAGSHTQVMITVDGNEYILCHLSKKSPQQTLDLNFQGGDSLVLHINGETPQPVHLTGFYNEIDDDDDMDDLMRDASDDEDEEVPDLVPAKLSAQILKRKKEADGKSSKKAKLDTSLMETEADSGEEDDSDEEEEDDKEIDGADDADLEEEEVEEGFSDEDEDDEDDDDDDIDEDEDESDDEEDDEDESAEEEEKPVEAIPLKKKKDTPAKKEAPAPKKETPAKKQPTPQVNGTAGGDASAKKKIKDEPKSPPKPDKKAQQTPKSVKKTLPGGVMVEDLVVGAGAAATRGRPVSVYYVGRLKQNNKQFDATVGGPGFRFKLGAREVIKGWDVGVEGMKVGGKRRITCPPHMAYGARGSPPVIPPNSALVFDVTLKNVH